MRRRNSRLQIRFREFLRRTPLRPHVPAGGHGTAAHFPGIHEQRPANFHAIAVLENMLVFDSVAEQPQHQRAGANLFMSFEQP